MTDHVVTTGKIQQTPAGRIIKSSCTCGRKHTLHEGRPSKWISFENEGPRIIAIWARDHAKEVGI